VAAVAALRTAEVIVADRLVPAAILALRQPGVEIFVAKKTYGRAHKAQEELYEACLAAVKRGRRVVRLKGGDPFVFGRGGEEVLRFRRAGVDVAVVPGISSCMSGPLLGGVPVTHRGVANQFVVTTAHGRDDTGEGGEKGGN
jgi:uroporphyrin-III C-methyltransferase